MKTTKILAICGSLRARSSNLSLLQATQKLAPENWEITFFDGLADLPHFNPDNESDEPAAPVAAFRQLLRDSDAVIICTPEYAHGLPGSFKNALDWTVSSGEWMEKPTLVLNASIASHFANDNLLEILNTIMAKVLPYRIGISGNKLDAAAIIENAEIVAKVLIALEDLKENLLEV